MVNSCRRARLPSNRWEKDVPMLLHQLISELDPTLNLAGIANVEISGVCEDSRTAQPGDLFIARAGKCTEGAKFIGQAVQRGAAAVVTAEKSPDCLLPQIVVTDPAMSASAIAHIFYGHPSRKIRVVGITGTNG